ncbi:MAG TPA: hypothetical protein VMY41_02550 [Thermohalobaculum sp.]|nr:hypothetical protein [Thermohalobaculum sp.]
MVEQRHRVGLCTVFFMGRSKQSTNLASISSTNLMELPVTLPPKLEQAEIVEHIARRCPQAQVRAVVQLSPIFFEAAWELCRRGIVRPGIRHNGEQAVEDGGYSLTVAGAAALDQLDVTDILITQPGSLATTFAEYLPRYGEAFHQRAQEAIKCRNVEAWLACCAMAGAAAESVLLALAIDKLGDEEKVLSLYRRAGGRKNVLNIIVGQANAITREQLSTFSNIISYWRDEAAHGRVSPISTANADEALRQLLHMCQWVNREWVALTA